MRLLEDKEAANVIKWSDQLFVFSGLSFSGETLIPCSSRKMDCSENAAQLEYGSNWLVVSAIVFPPSAHPVSTREHKSKD